MSATEFNGTIATDIRDSVPDWAPYRQAVAPEGAPNVLYLLWDDTGIATWECFGGLVEMPNMARLAARGVRMTQFHTTALCSPTRASLLTGRNPTSVGVSSIVNVAQGFPGQHGRIPAETALLSEVLAERGWSTYAVGKWHLAPPEDCHAAGSRRHWPLSRGFDRFYGFLDGMTDQWYPSLVADSRPMDPPATPEEGYHLSKDLADNAIGFLRDHRAAAPDKPWFMYLCPGAGHSPHQVDAAWADRYRGRFDMGYERYRDVVLANQKALGLLPENTEQSPMNPYADRTSAEGLPWPERENVLPWDTLSDDEKRVSSRMAEVFAGFLSYTDFHIGRVLDFLEETGQLDDTIVVVMSDNGASGEGGPSGTLSDLRRTADREASLREAMARFDGLGGPGTTMNYSTGWAMAFNTPYKMYKRYASHEGGIADPCIVSWPNGLAARGEVRDHYVHVGDVTPTVYDLLGIAAPDTVEGIPQQPLDGVSFAGALRDSTADRRDRPQFYSMMGTRGIWHDGWFAGTVHPPTTVAPRGWSDFEHDRWELFHVDVDRSQCHDLADRHPDRLESLKALWHELATTYNGYPLNDLSMFELVARGAVDTAGAGDTVRFFAGAPAGQTPMGGLIRGRSFTLRAAVTRTADDAQGVLFSQGDRAGGQVLYLADGRPRYACTQGGTAWRVDGGEPIPPGPSTIGVRFTSRGMVEGTTDVVGDVDLTVDDRVVGSVPDARMTVLDMMQAVSAGRSVAYSVVPEYTSPFPLQGATLGVVELDVAGTGAVHPTVVADLGFARD
jgi:arylsulfatase A-like enzyme